MNEPVTRRSETRWANRPTPVSQRGPIGHVTAKLIYGLTRAANRLELPFSAARAEARREAHYDGIRERALTRLGVTADDLPPA